MVMGNFALIAGKRLVDAINRIGQRRKPRGLRKYHTSETFERSDLGREIKELYEVGHDRCLEKFAWTSGKSGTAMSYATLAMMGDVLFDARMPEAFHRQDVRDFFDRNASALRASPKAVESRQAELTTYLTGKGWPGGSCPGRSSGADS